MTEPLASPTLALLYLAQGHRRRARATLDEVLELEPDNGYALALAERMRERPSATLEVRFVSASATAGDLGAGELELRWAIPRELVGDRRIDVVVAFATRRRPSLRYTSIACLDLAGSRRLAAPLGPASAAVAVVASAPERAIEILAVAPPPSW